MIWDIKWRHCASDQDAVRNFGPLDYCVVLCCAGGCVEWCAGGCVDFCVESCIDYSVSFAWIIFCSLLSIMADG